MKHLHSRYSSWLKFAVAAAIASNALVAVGAVNARVGPPGTSAPGIGHTDRMIVQYRDALPARKGASRAHFMGQPAWGQRPMAQQRVATLTHVGRQFGLSLNVLWSIQSRWTPQSPVKSVMPTL